MEIKRIRYERTSRETHGRQKDEVITDDSLESALRTLKLRPSQYAPVKERESERHIVKNIEHVIRTFRQVLSHHFKEDVSDDN